MTDQMVQKSPFPAELTDLVEACVYRPGWQIELRNIDRGQGSSGLTLVVTTIGYDTYDITKGQTYQVSHFFPVPPAAYNRKSWQHWLFEQLCLIEQHECMEFFQIDGERPYAPLHGPGNDPYMVTEERTDIERRTKYTGEISD